MKNILNIAKKELKAYLDSPSAYIAVVVFLLMWEFIFFRNAFLIREVSLRGLFQWLPWLFIVLIPAVTMNTISKEKEDGTIELVLTHPVSELQWILGKFISSVVFICIPFLFTYPIAAAFAANGNFDWGVYAGQFIGSVLFGAALVSMGIFISSLFSSGVASLLISAAAGFGLIILGFDFVTQTLPLSFVSVAERLSPLSHYSSISRGVFDLRDLTYFMSFIALFLSLTFLQLIKRKFGDARKKYFNYQIGVIVFAAIAITAAVLGNRIPGRWDLTASQIYSLSPVTKNTLANLKDYVSLTLYASSKMPVQYAPIVRDTKDILADYKAFSKGNVTLKVLDPLKSEKDQTAAEAAGIQPVTVSTVGNNEFQAQKSYLGVVISYAGKSEVIPFIQSTSDLEYQLTSLIKKLTVKDKITVGMFDGFGNKPADSYFQILQQELSNLYALETVSVTAETETPVIDEKISVLILPDTTEEPTEKVKLVLRDFIDRGGSVLFMAEAHIVNATETSVTSQANAGSLASLFADYGINVSSDVAYDFQLRENVRIGNGSVTYAVPYSFWIRALPFVDPKNVSPITYRIDNAFMPWTSPITVDEAKITELGRTSSKVLIGSSRGGSVPVGTNMAPDNTQLPGTLGEQTLALALEGEGKSKIIVFGNTDMFSDVFVQNAPQNMGLALNSVSWLAQDESLGSIKLKDTDSNLLVFKSSAEPTVIKITNLVAVVLLPAFLGFVRLTRRRVLRNKGYVNEK